MKKFKLLLIVLFAVTQPLFCIGDDDLFNANNNIEENDEYNSGDSLKKERRKSYWERLFGSKKSRTLSRRDWFSWFHRSKPVDVKNEKSVGISSITGGGDTLEVQQSIADDSLRGLEYDDPVLKKLERKRDSFNSWWSSLFKSEEERTDLYDEVNQQVRERTHRRNNVSRSARTVYNHATFLKNATDNINKRYSPEDFNRLRYYGDQHYNNLNQYLSSIEDGDLKDKANEILKLYRERREQSIKAEKRKEI